jgi:hypothetical protein
MEMGLLTDIARCPNVAQCIHRVSDVHPCSRIVLSQQAGSVAEFQTPEPWSGLISQAPILFVSSNPSIEPTTYEQYPRAIWDNRDIEDYFEHRFGGSHLSSVVDGIYGALPLSSRGHRAVAFWKSVRARAAEILNMPKWDLVPGQDYALTEVVRCKSIGEHGVTDALSTCTDLYLGPTLQESVARTFVCFGKHAADVVRSRYGIGQAVLDGPMELEGRKRMIVFLPHPSAWGTPKTLGGWIAPTELRELQAWTLAPE